MSILSHLIQKKSSQSYPTLEIHKYRKKVFYKNLWNRHPRLVESRGHVYCGDTLVVNPLTKIFNYKENNTTIDDNEACLYVEKINGFMACATWVPEVNDVVVSTTGSLDSPFVAMAKQAMPGVIEVLKERKDRLTYIFEIVHPSDPHIIPENMGVYLLAKRDPKDTRPYFTTMADQVNLNTIAKELGVTRPHFGVRSFKHLRESKPKNEGVVVYGMASKTVLKLKSPYYLAKKAAARIQDIETLDARRIDEDFYPLLDHLKENRERFNSLPEQERLVYIRNWLDENQ